MLIHHHRSRAASGAWPPARLKLWPARAGDAAAAIPKPGWLLRGPILARLRVHLGSGLGRFRGLAAEFHPCRRPGPGSGPSRFSRPA